jgi:prolipoprotein diacylglyceryltransferase
LYESLALAVLTLILWRRRDRLGPPGTIFGLYLAAAGVIRFLVEAVRTNPPSTAGLTEAQWTSLVLVAAAGVWLAQRHRPTRAPRQVRFR